MKQLTFSPILVIWASVALGVSLIAYGTQFLMSYGSVLFLGAPFFVGFLSSLLLNWKATKSVWVTVLISFLVTILTAFSLLSLGMEGLICLMMALPISLPFCMGGALLARYLLDQNRKYSPPTFAAWLVIVPLAMFGEHAARFQPPEISVKTSVVIAAPVSTVWRNVIAFPALKVPDEWFFKLGIAYPNSAVIVGSGTGALRYCRFSTGDFVEPVTTWEENHLLAFNVSAQPPAMRELSPWNISPPHLEQNNMRSRHGQFRLVALNDHQTLLEGTTWYQNYFWPQPYWRVWSNMIVHRIHLRVLNHIKEISEASAKAEISTALPRPSPSSRTQASQAPDRTPAAAMD